MAQRHRDVHRVVEQVDVLDPRRAGLDRARARAPCRARRPARPGARLSGSAITTSRRPPDGARGSGSTARAGRSPRRRRRTSRSAAARPEPGEGLELGLGLADAREDVAGALDEQLARIGRADALRKAPDQQCARLRLEHPDLPRDRGLGIAEGLGRGAENDPWRATSIRTRRRRTSSITRGYTSSRQPLFAFMATEAHAACHEPIPHPIASTPPASRSRSAPRMPTTSPSSGGSRRSTVPTASRRAHCCSRRSGASSWLPCRGPTGP